MDRYITVEPELDLDDHREEILRYFKSYGLEPAVVVKLKEYLKK